MRILHFCHAFSVLSETFIYDLISELEVQGLDNHVVTFQRENPEVRPFANVTVVPKTARLHPERLYRRLLAALGICEPAEARWIVDRRRLNAVLRRIGPDVVHAHFGTAGVIIAPVAYRLGIPLLVSCHGYDVTQCASQGLWRRKYRELWPQVTAATGVSHHICGRLEELGAPPEKILRISNGVKLKDFPYQNPADRYDGKNVECLFVGRLVEKKGPLLLVKSFQRARQLAGDKGNLMLHIVGGGPLEPALKAFCRQEKLEDCVRVYGPRDHSEVKRLMHRAHIYVQHSVTAADGDQEGQGVTLIEASASGLPIVVTRHNGFPDVVIDGVTGFLVGEHDIAAMGEKIAMLAGRPDLWTVMGKNGRSHVEACMDIEKQAQAWKQLYENVSKRNSFGTAESLS